MEEAELEKAGNEGEDEGEVATWAFKKLQIGEHSGTEGQVEIDSGDDLKLSQVLAPESNQHRPLRACTRTTIASKQRLVRTAIVPVTEFC